MSHAKEIVVAYPRGFTSNTSHNTRLKYVGRRIERFRRKLVREGKTGTHVIWAEERKVGAYEDLQAVVTIKSSQCPEVAAEVIDYYEPQRRRCVVMCNLIWWSYSEHCEYMSAVQGW